MSFLLSSCFYGGLGLPCGHFPFGFRFNIVGILSLFFLKMCSLHLIVLFMNSSSNVHSFTLASHIFCFLFYHMVSCSFKTWWSVMVCVQGG
jgi:hypothetical protein